MKKALYLFSELNDRDVDWLITVGNCQQVPNGTTLIQVGEPIDALYFILSGRVSIEFPSVALLEAVVLGPGEVLGEMSYIDARPPTATVRAKGDCEVFAIPHATLGVHLASDPGFAARFYRAIAIFLSTRLRGTVSRLGYGDSRDGDQDSEDPDELDVDELNKATMAGTRFDSMLRNGGHHQI